MQFASCKVSTSFSSFDARDRIVSRFGSSSSHNRTANDLPAKPEYIYIWICVQMIVTACNSTLICNVMCCCHRRNYILWRILIMRCVFFLWRNHFLNDVCFSIVSLLSLRISSTSIRCTHIRASSGCLLVCARMCCTKRTNEISVSGSKLHMASHVLLKLRCAVLCEYVCVSKRTAVRMANCRSTTRNTFYFLCSNFCRFFFGCCRCCCC